MEDFRLGLLTMGSLVIALFFLRFWAKSRDRLFISFSIAFALLAVNWGALVFVNRDEAHAGLYALRLVAFGAILVAIWNKNRRPAT